MSNDPIGKAISDYQSGTYDDSIIVESDLCDDDVIPVDYLFRSYDEMPELEQIALNRCRGKILDIGAAAGPHSSWLLSKSYDVLALDSSAGAVEYLKKQNIKAEQGSIQQWESTEKFDTILLLMNGIGMAGKLSSLKSFLLKLRKNLTAEGQILCDSSDISYLFEEEDGSIWVNLNQDYHGEMQFRMSYKNEITDWFSWLYLDFDQLSAHAADAGLTCDKLADDGNNAYLARLTISHE